MLNLHATKNFKDDNDDSNNNITTGYTIIIACVLFHRLRSILNAEKKGMWLLNFFSPVKT